jgi:hypothetical protein
MSTKLVSAAAVALAFSASAGAASLTEGFNTLTTVGLNSLPTGWSSINNSTTAGTSSWFNGTLTVFGPQEGTGYIGANFNSTTGNSTISNWLVTPNLTFNNGDVIRFYTRTVDTPAYPDRLELRFGAGAGTAPFASLTGAGTTGVGSFSTTLLTVNSGLTVGGYPNVWTLQTATISGLSGPTAGMLAFRYFVTSAGSLGSNSDYIGIDNFSITAVPEPATYLLMALGVGALALRRKQA